MTDFTKVKLSSLKSRKNKVFSKDFSLPDSDSLGEMIPGILAGKDLKELKEVLRRARKAKSPILWMVGAHVVKCGLGPLLIRLMEERYITHLATNGAAPIHDLEIALIGETSEDVESGIRDGSFGMAKETGEIINQLINSHHERGLGESFGKAILEGHFPHKSQSVFAQAIRNNVTVTVHSAIGTEIIQMHPSYDCAQQSRKTYADFQKMIETVGSLNDKSVVLNIGSGVILPEVFLRSLNISRNLGMKAFGFTTAVFDMERLFRPYENVKHRPTQDGGKGFYFVGQHELMIPLLYWLLLREGEQIDE
jgi:deoxyhypusine synthase